MAGSGYVTKGYTTYDEIEPTYQGYVCNDHVCRPVIVDAEGRKRPIIRYTETSGYATKIPEVTSYKVHTPECTSNKTPEYTSNNYGGSVNNDKLGSPPRKFDYDFITKVETHYPTKTTNTNYWQTTMPLPTNAYCHPNTMTSGLYESEWPKSNHPLTTTTNDIGEAVDFLKHAITEPPHAQPWGVQKRRESYVVQAETMDSSREAARRYARPAFKQPPSIYVGSREAVHKYDGNGMI